MNSLMKKRSGVHALLISLVTMIGLMCSSLCVSAISVPVITVDPGCTTFHVGGGAVLIKGTVSAAKGQKLAMYAKDGRTVLSEISLENTRGPAMFSIQVPTKYLKIPGKVKIYLRTLPAKGVAASKPVRMNVHMGVDQNMYAPNKVVLTNLKATSVLKVTTSSRGPLTYRSSNPKIVSVSSKGKLKRKKNGRVTITVSQGGTDLYLPRKAAVTVVSRKSTRREQINGAVKWAVKIANNNSFSYGSGPGAHRYGCYFCGTNYGPVKYMKPSKRYKKTYCCNPFVHAAYAHGAKHPKMLAACRKGSGIGMDKSTFYRYGCWECVGKPGYRNLQKGDVLVKSSHVAMYIGKGKLVEASSGNWSAGSIAVKSMSGNRYNGFSYVMRYTGY